jgi:hypothetical protein
MPQNMQRVGCRAISVNPFSDRALGGATDPVLNSVLEPANADVIFRSRELALKNRKGLCRGCMEAVRVGNGPSLMPSGHR